MSAPDATLFSATAADPQDRQARLHDWRLRMLEATAEHGVALLDDMRRKAQEAPSFDARVENDPGLSYSRIARAMRQTVMLHARLEEEANKTEARKAAEAAAALAAEAQRAAAIEAGHRAHQKRQVRRAVKEAIGLAIDLDETDTRDYAEAYAGLYERLDDYDEYSDFGRLPVGAVVANICRVIGIAFDPALWADEPWAIAERQAKPEGSPYADWSPAAETARDDDEAGEDGGDDPFGPADDEDDDRPNRRSRAPPELHA